MSRTTSTNFGMPGTSYPLADAGTDPFLKEDVQDLAAAVDDHDHSAGRGLAVQRLGTGVVVEANLANDAATFDKVADHASTDALRAIGANHIRTDAVITRTILDGAVTATKLGTGASVGLSFPRCYAGYVVNSQAPSNATLTALSFTNPDIYDTFGGHSTSVNTTRITIATTGAYIVFGFVGWAPNATGSREVYFRFNRSGVDTYLQAGVSVPPVSPLVTYMTLAAPFVFQAADYVELVVYQSSGGVLTVQDAGFGVIAFGS